MKTLLTLLSLCVAVLSFSQENIYTLRVKNTQNRPMPNVVVTAECTEKNIVLKATTNSNGEAVFKLPEVGIYTLSYLEMKNVATAEVKEGFYGEFTRSVTYDPKGQFAVKPKSDRTGIAFKDVAPTQLKGQPKVGLVNILVKQPDGTTIPGIPVKLVSITDKTRYSNTSNASGKAVFYVPIGKDYEVDVENLQAFKVISVPNHDGLEMNETAFYEKTKVKEVVKGDTIVQEKVTQTVGTTTHILFTLQLNNYEGVPLAGEPIFMSAQTGKRVYKGTTDPKGACVFMLEKGTNYILNFKYEQNVHLVEAPVSQGFKTASTTRRYRGSKQIEEMLAQQREEMRLAEIERKRLEAEMLKKIAEDQKLSAEYKKKALIPVQPIRLKPQYRSTPVEAISAPKDYLKKTAEGYDIQFATDGGNVTTPTLINNKLYAQHGTYSSNYYCLQAGNGSFVWGLALGESGLSPAVHHDGVLLINTYSCTLYAIEAVTGKLLWSKWLAGTVYSTPTAADDDVFVVYNHGGKHVLVSFGLRSGEFNWMQDLDNETIACPVVDGAEVHVASQSGTYYIFNKETGVRTATTKDVYVHSSPTISGDKIFVTAVVKGEEKLVVLDRKTLDIRQTYDSPLSVFTADNANGAVGQMNFNGSHPVVYQNKYVVLTDRNKIYAFDALSEQKLWEQPLAMTTEQIPVIANNKAYIVSAKGDVMAYDLATGKPEVVRKGAVKDEAEGQPICGNGFLFIATAGVLKAIKTIPGLSWNQWNKDAGHNTVYK